MRAITWPFFTRVLKSTSSSWMRPETWLPTSTVTTGDSVPVAVTWLATRPRQTSLVS